MIRQQNGHFLVKAGEIITVTVKASDTEDLAAFSDLSSGNWIMTSLPNVPPDPLAEVRKFVMPDVATDIFDVQFGFIASPAGAPTSYHVNIVGSDPAGAPFDQDIPNPNSPLPPDRLYTFVTTTGQ
jgi:hypothetical protein